MLKRLSSKRMRDGVPRGDSGISRMTCVTLSENYPSRLISIFLTRRQVVALVQSEIVIIDEGALQAVPLMQDLPEYKALEDEEGRRAAFTRYVKRQKVCGLYLFTFPT